MRDEKAHLHEIHVLRLKAHGHSADAISRAPWPKDDKEWRQTEHGAPWDSNVNMARWHLRVGRLLRDKGLLDA